jgi:large subunit ribosomal protein L2
MGKKLHQQRRGKGSGAYTKHPGTFNISVAYPQVPVGTERLAEVVSIFNSTGHNAPIINVIYDDLSTGTLIAPEGIKVGDKIKVGATLPYGLGSVMKLSEIPKGFPIYNIERRPNDGGKMVRAAGESAYISAQTENESTIVLPSKKTDIFTNNCRAQLGVVAGGGIKDQVIVKAGKSHYMMHALNRMWPRHRGVKMNPVDHPFGGKQHHKGKSSMTSRNAPPGRKVGHIAASRTGRKKR